MSQAVSSPASASSDASAAPPASVAADVAVSDVVPSVAEGAEGPGFVHLRMRSEYSVVDSIVRLDEAVAAAVADGQMALALSDASNLFGWVKFYKQASGKGLQPICAADVWITNAENRDRPYRLLLIAANNAGYRRLCELLSRAWLENEYKGHAELLPEWLTAETTGGLIALSGAGGGEVGQFLLAGNHARAVEVPGGDLADGSQRRDRSGAAPGSMARRPARPGVLVAKSVFPQRLRAECAACMAYAGAHAGPRHDVAVPGRSWHRARPHRSCRLPGWQHNRMPAVRLRRHGTVLHPYRLGRAHTR